MILERVSAGQVRKVAVQQGMSCLREDGWRLVRQGRTTVEEVLCVTKDERINGDGLDTEPRSAAPETASDDAPPSSEAVVDRGRPAPAGDREVRE
jgi:hypothetical protein